MSATPQEHIAVTKFRDYLRINTEQPNPGYYACRDFLYKYAEEVGLTPWTYECVPGKPIVGMTLKGTDPSLPSILLYSHTDVVPTFPEHWTHPPYEAHKDKDGKIFARGTQDMKSMGVQYMEALRELKKQGKNKFLRSIHVVWGPDEEIGSHDGMEKYVQSQHFKDLNVGFNLDEGISSEDDVYRLYYGQRCTWWVKITCPGNPGHGSRFFENTPGPKLASIIKSVSEYREKQLQLLKANPKLTFGEVTSVNLTKVVGGVETNVIPPQFVAHFDFRITPTEDLTKMENQIAEWCKKAGSDVTYEFEQKLMNKTLTPTTRDDPWFNVFATVMDEEKCKFATEISICGTDARYIRELDIPAIGLSPMINTPILLHDHDEYLEEKTFLRGLELYVKIIERLANVPKQ